MVNNWEKIKLAKNVVNIMLKANIFVSLLATPTKNIVCVFYFSFLEKNLIKIPINVFASDTTQALQKVKIRDRISFETPV